MLLMVLMLVGRSMLWVLAELAVLLLPCPASSAGRMPWRIRTIVARP